MTTRRVRPPYRILFVCMGNICRSPSGENVFRHLATARGVGHRFEADSAGTIDFHEGKPADPRMAAAAHARGIALEGKARKVRPADLATFDLILAMDRENMAELRELDRSSGAGAARDGRLQMFCDFCKRHSADVVPDPYYGGPEGFEEVLDLLEDGCAEIIGQVMERRGFVPPQRKRKRRPPE